MPPEKEPTTATNFTGSGVESRPARDESGAFSGHLRQSIEVLRDVSFSVAAGETVAVMGASGAGKSTLLNLLGGLETGDGGTIQFSRLETGEATGYHRLARQPRQLRLSVSLSAS